MYKIYLAASFEWIELIREYARILRSLGFVVTSRWHDEQSYSDPKTNISKPDGSTDLSREEQAFGYACRDIRNILEADTLILFTPGTAFIRNTRLAEFGGALFTGRKCIVIGPENPELRANIDTIFVFLKSLPPDLQAAGIQPVEHFHKWEEWLGTLIARRTVVQSACEQ